MKKIIIELSIPDEDFKQYGDIGMYIKDICGGVYSWNDAIKEIKRAYITLTHNAQKTDVKK